MRIIKKYSPEILWLILKNKNMKKLLFALMAFVALNAAAQTKIVNDPNAKARELTGEFTAVSVATGIELYLTQGNEVSLAVSSSDPKFEEGFKTIVKDGVLKIYYEQKESRWEKGRILKAYLSVKSLEKLMVSSGAKINTVNTFNAGNLAISISSGAQFEGAIKANELTVDQSSGSKIDIAGSAGTVNVEASSGASFNGFELAAETCTAKVSSGAAIKITANKELNANASSGGSVKYKGSAATNNIRKSSGGSVTKS